MGLKSGVLTTTLTLCQYAGSWLPANGLAPKRLWPLVARPQCRGVKKPLAMKLTSPTSRVQVIRFPTRFSSPFILSQKTNVKVSPSVTAA